MSLRVLGWPLLLLLIPIILSSCKPRGEESRIRESSGGTGCGENLAISEDSGDLGLNESSSVFQALDIECADVDDESAGGSSPNSPNATQDQYALSDSGGQEAVEFLNGDGKVVANMTGKDVVIAEYPDEDPAYFLQELAGKMNATPPPPTPAAKNEEENGMNLQGETTCTPRTPSEEEAKEFDLVSSAAQTAYHLYCHVQCNPWPADTWDKTPADDNVALAVKSCEALRAALGGLKQWLSARASCGTSSDKEAALCANEGADSLADIVGN